VPKSGCLRSLCWMSLCLLGVNLTYFVWSMDEAGYKLTKPNQSRGAVANIYLLSELNAQSSVREASHLLEGSESISSNGENKSVLDSIVQCAQIGAYTELDDAKLWQGKITKEHYKVALKPLVVEKGLEYWVLIVSRKNGDAALKMLRELQKKKLDSYLVTQGVYENAISLGLFVNEASAIRVSERVSSMGYPAAVYERTHRLSEYWLEIDLKDEPELRKNRLHELMDGSKKIKILNSLCETFAHSQ